MLLFTRLLQFLGLLLLSLSLATTADAAREKKEKKEPAYPNATREEPEIKPSSRVNKQLVNMYELSQKEDHDKTLEAAEAVLANKHAGAYEKSLALQTIAFVHSEREDYTQALDYLNRSLEANGFSNDNYFQILLQIAQMYLAEDNFDKGLEVMKRFMAESGSDKPEHFAMLGNIHYRLENYPEAAAQLKRAIEGSDKPQPSWLQLLMAAYFETGNEAEAAAIAEQVLASDPDDLPMIRNLAAIYLQQEQNEKALEILNGARERGLLTEDRDYTQLYQLYHYMEREADAIATIEEGLQKGILKPGREVYIGLAEAYYFSDKPAEAAEAYRKAAPFAKDGEVAINLARVLMEIEDYKGAVAAANEALQKGIRRRGDASFIIGGAELEQNNANAAVAAYKEAAKNEETKASAQSWLRASGIR